MHPLRLLLKTREAKKYLSYDYSLALDDASAWCRKADFAFRKSVWKDMAITVNLDLN